MIATAEAVMPQISLPLFDPTEPRVLPQDGRLWFAVCRPRPGGGLYQNCYHLTDMPGLLPALRGIPDRYVSQGTFMRAVRRNVHVAALTHGYLDLDTYKSNRWCGLPPDEVVQELLWHCDDEDIPRPSVILSSGRGYYPKWFWSQPIPRAMAGLALAVNRTLCRSFAPFEADPRAVDLTRVLRIAGTVNSRNSKPCEIVWWNGPDDAPVTYEFEAFARSILPNGVEEVEEPAADRPQRGRADFAIAGSMAQRTGKRSAFPREHWHWGVLEDIRTLAAMRYPGGIVQRGMRDLFGHLAACQLARVVGPSLLFHEIVATARTFLPPGYAADELLRHSSTLLERAKRAAAGEVALYQGWRVTPVYTYSKARLMEELRIEPHEEQHMTRLVSDDEKRRRKAGVMKRDAWLAANSIERERPWEAEGISRRAWYYRQRKRAGA